MYQLHLIACPHMRVEKQLINDICERIIFFEQGIKPLLFSLFISFRRLGDG